MTTIPYTPQSLFDTPDTSIVTNDFTHLSHAFNAAPGFHGTVVRDGSPMVVLGAEVVVALLPEFEHASATVHINAIAVALTTPCRFIPLSTVSDRRGQRVR